MKKIVLTFKLFFSDSEIENLKLEPSRIDTFVLKKYQFCKYHSDLR